jgi:hypothetical protein
MTAAEIYWPYVAFAMGAAAVIPFVCFALARRWSWIALIVGLACLAIVIVNGAAPIRGLVDPNYVGYGYGFLRAEKGLEVTFMAGSVVLFSALSSWIAIRNRPGPLMLIVAATSAFHLVNAGFPLMDGLLADPKSVEIQFGEYLTVPYTVAIPAILAVMVLPFLLGLPWAIQRTLETE